MKKIQVGLVILCAFILQGCCGKVEPGWEGILVNQYGDQRGIEDFPIRTGRVWYNLWTQDLYKLPTFMQNVVWTKDPAEGSPNDDSITFNSIEGAEINADIGLSYQFRAGKTPAIFLQFRQSPEHITNVYLRTKVRDCFNNVASKMKVTSIFGEDKELLIRNTKENLIKEVGDWFNIDGVSFTGALRVDESVKKSINATIEATQRGIEAENKIVQSKAEATQKIEEARGKAQSLILEASGQAQANEIVAKSITPELIQFHAVQNWNGILPMVSGQGVQPLISFNANDLQAKQ